MSLGKIASSPSAAFLTGAALPHHPSISDAVAAIRYDKQDKLKDRLTEARKKGEVNWLRPDSKSQVTVEFDGDRPVRIDTVVVSTQHSPDVSHGEIRQYVIENVIKPVLPQALVNGEITYHVNPTGRFVTGGPHGDCGLTGRKIIVDTYGGWARHGGGAFSGKDPTKVDRSAAYMARHVAKNIVAAGLADRCEVQLAYAIGISEPVSVLVDTDGSGKVSDERLCKVVREVFPLTPGGIIKYLDLRRPIDAREIADRALDRLFVVEMRRDFLDQAPDYPIDLFLGSAVDNGIEQVIGNGEQGTVFTIVLPRQQEESDDQSPGG